MSRGIFAGGIRTDSTVIYDNIDYVTIETIGNATDFGNLTFGRRGLTSCSNGSNDRCVFAGGAYIPSAEFVYIDNIDYVTMSSTGNSTDFGDLTVARDEAGGCSNSNNERGVFSGGNKDIGLQEVIDYITISTTANATDFGDTLVPIYRQSGLSNGTGERGLFGGGGVGGQVNVIQYITINTTGDSTDFGNLLGINYGMGATSNGNNNRGVWGGGSNSLNVIQYLSIVSLGDTIDFGDLTTNRAALSATSNGTNERGIFGGGGVSTSSPSNVVDYITINTPTNATDFGNLTVARLYLSGSSNAPSFFVPTGTASKWQAGVAISNMQYMMTIDRDSIDIHSLEADGMLIPVFVPTPTNDRGVWMGGYTGSVNTDVIEYIAISTLGDGTDFGDLIEAASNLSATSNGANQRGIAITSYTLANDIEYITINTLGNATYFGDATLNVQTGSGGVSNQTNDRAVWMGGSGISGNRTNVISYVTITSLGDATDFGDCISNVRSPAPQCNGTNERGQIGGGYG